MEVVGGMDFVQGKRVIRILFTVGPHWPSRNMLGMYLLLERSASTWDCQKTLGLFS